VPYLPPDFAPRERMILLEGETDTMATWQALPDRLRDKVGIVGLSGTGSWGKAVREKGGLESLFGQAKRVFVPFDRDDPYENPDGAASVERAWKEIRSDLGNRARRIMLPQGINDVAEFFQTYDWAAFEVLLKQASEPKRNYPRLDLLQPIPDTDWLVEDFLVSSEATVLAGDGGVGKSWITMALALAVAGGEEKFLGLPVKKHGPVIYVDEESSRELFLQRIHALGFDPKIHLPNLEVIWYRGVDLLNEPERLLEDVQEIEPVLVVADSLSRVAIGAEENDNTAMTKLMRAGVIPIARESGAAVLLTHHTDASGSRLRGATSIRNAADQAIMVSKATSDGIETGRLNIFPDKPRRRTAHISAVLEGDMEKDGQVRVNPAYEEDAF
jgi:KaiC/GvpD/RAD55 family RecA-like ATPase